MNKNSKGLPKIDILVYAVDFGGKSSTSWAFEQIRLADNTTGRPFGKLDMHGPIELDNGALRVYATAHLNIDQYMRKCIYSYEEKLVGICAQLIKQQYPEKMNYFWSVYEQAKQIRQQIIERNAKRQSERLN